MNANDISRGVKAKAILEDEMFREAVEAVQKSIFDEFAEIEPSDVAKLQVCRLRLNALAEVTRRLASVMNTGKLAEVEREREQTIAQRTAERLKRGIRSVF